MTDLDLPQAACQNFRILISYRFNDGSCLLYWDSVKSIPLCLIRARCVVRYINPFQFICYRIRFGLSTVRQEDITLVCPRHKLKKKSRHCFGLYEKQTGIDSFDLYESKTFRHIYCKQGGLILCVSVGVFYISKTRMKSANSWPQLRR